MRLLRGEMLFFFVEAHRHPPFPSAFLCVDSLNDISFVLLFFSIRRKEVLPCRLPGNLLAAASSL